MTYKQIVKNSIDRQMFRHLQTVCDDRYATIEDVKLRQDGDILFVADVKAQPFVGAPFQNTFEIHGYVSEYGDAVMTYISYERDIIVEREDGTIEGQRTKHYHLHGLEMKAFTFNN